MNARYGYLCDICGKTYWTHNLAVRCCTGVQVRGVFLCSNCKKGYKKEAEAEACCAPTVPAKEAQ